MQRVTMKAEEAGLEQKDVELLTGQLTAKVDIVIRTSLTKEVIERRAMQK